MMKTACSLIGLVLLGCAGVACLQQTFCPSAGWGMPVGGRAYEKPIWLVTVSPPTTNVTTLPASGFRTLSEHGVVGVSRDGYGVSRMEYDRK